MRRLGDVSGASASSALEMLVSVFDPQSAKGILNLSREALLVLSPGLKSLYDCTISTLIPLAMCTMQRILDDDVLDDSVTLEA